MAKTRLDVDLIELEQLVAFMGSLSGELAEPTPIVTGAPALSSGQTFAMRQKALLTLAALLAVGALDRSEPRAWVQTCQSFV